MAATTEPTALSREEDDDSRPSAEDEDTGAEVAPIVRLQEVAVTTGEENDDVLLELRSKLYRYDGSQWKERGFGTVKLLKHRETGKFRLLMRQERTLRICAHHNVLPTMSLTEHHGNEKSCMWHASDFADGELREETFCIRFTSIENCRAFKDKIEEITAAQKEDSRESEEGTAADGGESEVGTTADGGESEEGTVAASLIEKLSVDAEDKEVKPKSNGESSSAG